MDNSDKSKQLSRERFGKFAAGYVTSQTHASVNELELLATLAGAKPHWQMLDIATGGGHTSLYFASQVSQVIAVDLTEAMLEAARKYHASKRATNIAYTAADAENLPFPSGSFDLVTCRIAAHHFPDVAAFVKEGARVLRKEGRFVFQDQVVPDDVGAGNYVNDFERKRDPSHHLAHDRQSWLKFFDMAGLTVSSDQIIAKQHNFLNWAQMQNCGPETITELVEMALHSPAIAYEWLQPTNFNDLSTATFRNQHIILLATKG
jgi:ubiquinone/menaquinone biosynthesis C-methylase UbiE